MNEFEKINGENNDADEIARIQNEIDKVLNANPPVEPQPAVQTPEVLDGHALGAETPVMQTPATQTPVTETPVIQTPAMQTHVTETPAAQTPPANAPAAPEPGKAAYTFNPAADTPPPEHAIFYHETIKEEGRGKKGFKRLIAFLTAACVLGGTAGGFFVGLNMRDAKRGVSAQNAANAPAPTVVETIKSQDDSAEDGSTFAFNDNAKPDASGGDYDLRAMSNRFVDIVNEVEPAVVAVTRTSAAAQNFYGYSLGNEQPDGAGSGIIFSEDSEKVYIVTNQHVVSGAESVFISVNGSDSVKARHVGSDSRADLAVISVTKSDLKQAGVEKVTLARFGDSDNIQVGEVVLAIGNALGEGNSTSMGLIGTKEKEMKISEHEQPLTLIQTSASINFGNSGGPLLNLDGEVIGINTAKASPMVGAEGLGYSIPSNIAKPIIEGFMNRSETPFLGISGSTITEEFAAMYSLPEAGVLIVSVFEDSSAARAGIQRTDIITSFNGEPVFTIEQLTDKIKNCKVGDKVDIQIIRDGITPMNVTATLDKYSDTDF